MKIIYKHISNASLDGNYAEDEAISVIFPKFPQRERRRRKKKKQPIPGRDLFLRNSRKN